MQQVEALREVKRAEAEVARLKEDASRQAAEEIRNAERKATGLIEAAKVDAEAAYQKGIKAAQESITKDRQKILKQGEAEAQGVVGKVGTPEFNKAVDVILGNLEKRAAHE